jgi:hypothetical protein
MEVALGRSALLAALLTALFLSVQAGGAATPALADTCGQPAPSYWECGYGYDSVPRFTPRWFNAPGNVNQRRWYWNEIADAYGGNVFKCPGGKAWNGYQTYLACGYGTFGAEFPANWRPGWVYIEQWANGPRVLFGRALQTAICC